jgi:hypothetical protein
VIILRRVSLLVSRRYLFRDLYESGTSVERGDGVLMSACKSGESSNKKRNANRRDDPWKVFRVVQGMRPRIYQQTDESYRPPTQSICFDHCELGELIGGRHKSGSVMWLTCWLIKTMAISSRSVVNSSNAFWISDTGVSVKQNQVDFSASHPQRSS